MTFSSDSSSTNTTNASTHRPVLPRTSDGAATVSSLEHPLARKTSICFYSPQRRPAVCNATGSVSPRPDTSHQSSPHTSGKTSRCGTTSATSERYESSTTTHSSAAQFPPNRPRKPSLLLICKPRGTRGVAL